MSIQSENNKSASFESSTPEAMSADSSPSPPPRNLRPFNDQVSQSVDQPTTEDDVPKDEWTLEREQHPPIQGPSRFGGGFGFADPSKGLVYNELPLPPTPPRPFRASTPPNCTVLRCKICNYPLTDWDKGEEMEANQLCYTCWYNLDSPTERPDDDPDCCCASCEEECREAAAGSAEC